MKQQRDGALGQDVLTERMQVGRHVAPPTSTPPRHAASHLLNMLESFHTPLGHAELGSARRNAKSVRSHVVLRHFVVHDGVGHVDLPQHGWKSTTTGLHLWCQRSEGIQTSCTR